MAEPRRAGPHPRVEPAEGFDLAAWLLAGPANQVGLLAARGATDEAEAPADSEPRWRDRLLTFARDSAVVTAMAGCVWYALITFEWLAQIWQFDLAGDVIPRLDCGRDEIHLHNLVVTAAIALATTALVAAWARRRTERCLRIAVAHAFVLYLLIRPSYGCGADFVSIGPHLDWNWTNVSFLPILLLVAMIAATLVAFWAVRQLADDLGWMDE